MHRNSLLTVTRGTFSLGLLLASAAAQAAVLPSQSAPAEAPGKQPGSLTAGLPEFLLLVPGGAVEVGLSAEELVLAVCQVVSPRRPDAAAKLSASKIELLMKQSASVLGPKKVDVPAFLLARAPVTCAQWERYLIEKRRTGKMRPPFDWWRYGAEEHYNQSLPEIGKEFPKDADGPVLYWERHGAELPYSLQTKDGKSFADQPVTYIDYRSANDFAAWLGMRLPTEAEWTRAARGDGTNVWPWGAGEQKNDVYSEEVLDGLRILKTKDKARKPVGSVDGNRGPFGHVDMFGHVWQLVAGTSYRPINGEEPFKDAWKQLQKDKVGALLTAPPLWKDDRALAKGGSFLSAGEPIQLLVDARAPMQTIDVLESVGLRLAKSLRPGYDMLYSLLRGTYDRSRFVRGQDIDLAMQAGIERYELGSDGFPTAYQAVSFAPVNWLATDPKSDLGKVLDQTQVEPLLVGSLATSLPLAEPSVPAGHYSVLYRDAGMPRELVEAIKAGHKEMQALAKKPKKEDAKEGEDGEAGEKDDKPADKPDKGDKKKAGWRDVLARFGLTEADVTPKEAANGLKFVRVDGFEVSTEHGNYLLHGNDGKVVAAIPSHKKLVAGAALASTLELGADAKNRMVVHIVTGAPISQQNQKRIVAVPFSVTLDRPAGQNDDWRLPTN
ncbi:MAG: SUMF1/EgtB/PvdO family nonheme iron enzyme [Planctomycetes bacterium]|nr:SUMF1/EgtB/PvdO family nonheme iron enzyme [Planctomycetota bacterium]